MMRRRIGNAGPQWRGRPPRRPRVALRTRGFLLLGQDGVEHGLLDVRLERAARGVDERDSAAVFQLRVLLLHVVLGAVIAELHVAGQRAHES